MTQLATADNLAARLGRDFTDTELAQVDALLTDVSARVRTYTGQTFTVRTGVERLRIPPTGIVRLPQRPVTDVASVKDTSGGDIGFAWYGDDRVYLTAWWSIIFDVEPYRIGPPHWADVDYASGYSAVPDDIIGVVCQIAGRAFGTPADQAGITQEMLGSYQYQRGGAAGSGPFGLLPDEREVLDSYRLVGGTLWISRASSY